MHQHRHAVRGSGERDAGKAVPRRKEGEGASEKQRKHNRERESERESERERDRERGSEGEREREREKEIVRGVIETRPNPSSFLLPFWNPVLVKQGGVQSAWWRVNFQSLGMELGHAPVMDSLRARCWT